MGRIRTWRVGEVGVEGTRVVLDGGRFRIGGKLFNGRMFYRTYQSDRLIPLVGEIIHFHDCDDLQNRIAVHECTFESSRKSSTRERLIVGRPLGFACEIKESNHA